MPDGTRDQGQGNNQKAPLGSTPPTNLPFGSDKTLLTHTMGEDVLRAKGDPTAIAKEEATKKPFSERIPPIPMPNGGASSMGSNKDAYREAVPEPPIPGRGQPYSFPGSDSEQAASEESQKQQFQIYIPPKQSSLRMSTMVLVGVLVLLIAGGSAAYWYFFMNKPAAETTSTTTTPAAPTPAPAPEPQPVIEPTPEPTPPPPPPAPEQAPVLVPEQPTSTSELIPPIATTTPPAPEPVPTPAPAPTPQPISEPAIPAAVLSLDQTVTIKIASLDKMALLNALGTENAKVIAPKATLRYLVELSSSTEKRFLSVNEVGTLLGFTIPKTLSSTFGQSDLIGYKDGNVFRYGFVAAISNKDSAKSAALSWESTAVDDLKGLYIQKAYVKPSPVSFASNTYLGFYKRYVNMPAPDVSLDWAVSDKYFVVATSKNMIFAVLDETGSPTTPAVAK